jgi:hypothetical protein
VNGCRVAIANSYWPLEELPPDELPPEELLLGSCELLLPELELPGEELLPLLPLLLEPPGDSLPPVADPALIPKCA